MSSDPGSGWWMLAVSWHCPPVFLPLGGQQEPSATRGNSASSIAVVPDSTATLATVGRQLAHVAVRLRTIRISGIPANSAAIENTTMAVRDTLNNAPMTMLPTTHAMP